MTYPGIFLRWVVSKNISEGGFIYLKTGLPQDT
jgi:hypothetical protein